MERRILVAYSVLDEAGRGAALRLVDLLGASDAGCPGAVECYESNNVLVAGFRAEPVELEVVDSVPDPSVEAVIVLSRHRSESGVKAYTVHHTGNPTRSTMGGDPETLSYSYPRMARRIFLALAEYVGGGADVTLEATHHGPTRPRKPVIFAELGSTPEHWRDRGSQEVLASAVYEALKRGPDASCREASGYGGKHYPRKINRLVLEQGYCVGHIISRYSFDEGVSEGVVRQSVEKTYPEPPRLALVEKKSLRSAQRRALLNALDALGVEVEMI